MKILWVTNVPFAHHNELLKKSNTAVVGGSWLYAAYDAVKEDTNIELHIVTSYSTNKYMNQQVQNTYFHILPGGNMKTYDYTSKKNRQMCELLKADIAPDIVVIWGTESKFAYLISEVFRNTPIVVYMQGVIQSIYQRYYDGVPSTCKLKTLRDFINLFNKYAQYRNFKIQPNLVFFRNNLPIRAEYFNYEWELDHIERHTIFVNAGGYPIKGHHILFQALAVVKRFYPDFKVYIPGNNYLKTFSTIKNKTGYFLWLQKIIDDNQLMENIEFTGALSPMQMAKHIQQCNVYVMPSVCENHSASLIEAMIVGAPCISSLVGGVSSLIENKKNGIIYNSLDYVALAGNIVRIFSDDTLASTLSVNAKKIRSSRQSDFGKEMNLIYYELVR